MMKKKIEVLSIEDNPADSTLISELFQGSALVSKLSFVSDGVEAMEYLQGLGNFQNSRLPDLILLDLNLPRKDGHALLKEIKSDPRFKQIPVMILSTSNAFRDIDQSYELHANAYFTKPDDWDTFKVTVRAIEDFWMQAQLPNAPKSKPAPFVQ
jgi:two-component system, chemotaxis family, response regulator Rcp1